MHHHNTLRELASQLNAPVRFADEQDDPTSFYEGVDAVVCSSRSPEGLGLTLLEGMARNRLAIGPMEGGVLDTLIDGVTGLNYIPRSVESLAERMRFAAENPGICAGIQEGGGRFVRARHNGGQMIRQLELAYSGATNGVKNFVFGRARPRPSVAVLLATYRRPIDLDRCLSSLTQQTSDPDEIVVVLRTADVASRQVVDRWLRKYPGLIRVVVVSRPGVLAANNEALPTITTEIVAFIDDDAEATPSWISSIREQFARDPGMGAFGGRDRFVHPAMIEESNQKAKQVGRLNFFGRLSGYHHRVSAGRRDVDSLKGCNMAFRRSLLSTCDPGLHGNACFYELDLCLHVRRLGYRIVFDPAHEVMHHLSPTFLDGFERGIRNRERACNEAFNQARVLSRHMSGWNRMPVFVYLMSVPAIRLARWTFTWQEFMDVWRSVLEGWRSGQKEQGMKLKSPLPEGETHRDDQAQAVHGDRGEVRSQGAPARSERWVDRERQEQLSTVE